MKSTMRRWSMSGPGLDKLNMETVPVPQPGIGEILVEVEAVSLNYRDVEVAQNGMGISLTFPFTPASDMAGRVVALGPGVTRFAVGDRVLSSCITGWIDGAPMSWRDAPIRRAMVR